VEGERGGRNAKGDVSQEKLEWANQCLVAAGGKRGKREETSLQKMEGHWRRRKKILKKDKRA